MKQLEIKLLKENFDSFLTNEHHGDENFGNGVTNKSVGEFLDFVKEKDEIFYHTLEQWIETHPLEPINESSNTIENIDFDKSELDFIITVANAIGSRHSPYVTFKNWMNLTIPYVRELLSNPELKKLVKSDYYAIIKNIQAKLG